MNYDRYIFFINIICINFNIEKLKLNDIQKTKNELIKKKIFLFNFKTP
jgi:hypothetical protein